MRGQVKLRSLLADPDAIFDYPALFDPSGKREFKLTHRGGNPPVFIADVAGISDRNAAELLKNTALYVDAAELPEKADNEWYHAELVGLEARTPDGKTYGKVTGIFNFGAGDIIELKLADGSSEMLPFNNAFIGDIHADKGYLNVTPPEYVEGENE